jgi:hypothetical protein
VPGAEDRVSAIEAELREAVADARKAVGQDRVE